MQVVGDETATACTSYPALKVHSHIVSLVHNAPGLEAYANCRDNHCHFEHAVPPRLSRQAPVTTDNITTTTVSPPPTIPRDPRVSTSNPNIRPRILFYLLNKLTEGVKSSRGCRTELKDLLYQVHSIQSPSAVDVLF